MLAFLLLPARQMVSTRKSTPLIKGPADAGQSMTSFLSLQSHRTLGYHTMRFSVLPTAAVKIRGACVMLLVPSR